MLSRLLLQAFSARCSRRFSSARPKTPIALEQEMHALLRKTYSNKLKRIYSFYCSDYDRIVVDQHLMLIPIDDRMATRSHAVFDTIYIKRMHIINVPSIPCR